MTARALAFLLLFGLAQTAPAQFRAPSRSRSAETVTYHNQIARIFQQRCQVCHRPGGIGPFELTNYPEAFLWAQFIENAVETRIMPPWLPSPGLRSFHNDRRLTDREIALIREWVRTGAREGDLAMAPEPLQFSSDWQLGEPDFVLEMPEYEPDRFGDDDYRCFSLPTGLGGERFVSAVEVQAGNLSIVHHVLLFPDPDNVTAEFGETGDPQPGYTCYGDPGFETLGFLGGWAPGNSPQRLPERTGYRVTANSRIVLQVHYHPNGTEQSDRTRVGLHFSDAPEIKELITLPLVNQTFTIPPGATDYEVTASIPVPAFLKATIYALTPHMHLLGRRIALDFTPSGGQTETLIEINDWDFNWQDTYWLVDPLKVDQGGLLKLRAYYDNSDSNLLNPNSPPVPVRWGPHTTDEMALVFISFVVDSGLPVF